MAKKVIWNRRASDSFNKIISYLQSEWGENVTQTFVNRTYQIIDFLAEHPEMGAIENEEKRIRGFLITKHNTVFYRVEDSQIILLKFFDNRQHPNKKSF